MGFNIDPNIWNAFSRMGQVMGQGGSYAEAAGAAGLETMQNRLAQKAAGKQLTMRDSALDAVRQGEIFTLDDDLSGTVKSREPGTDQTDGSLIDKPLEASTSNAKTAAGQQGVKDIEGVKAPSMPRMPMKAPGQLDPRVMQGFFSKSKRKLSANDLLGMNRNTLSGVMSQQNAIDRFRNQLFKEARQRKINQAERDRKALERLSRKDKLSKHERQIKAYLEANPDKSLWDAERAVESLGSTASRGTNFQFSVDAYMKENPGASELDAIKAVNKMKGMRSAGSFSKRTLYDRYGNTRPVYSQEEYERLIKTGNYTETDKSASQKQQKTFVDDSMEAWKKGAGFGATPSQVNKQREYYRQAFQTKRKAERGGWLKKYHPDLGEVYIVTKNSKEHKVGDVVNMAGVKVTEIKKVEMSGISDTMKKSHLKMADIPGKTKRDQAGEIYTYPMPKRSGE